MLLLLEDSVRGQLYSSTGLSRSGENGLGGDLDLSRVAGSPRQIGVYSDPVRPQEYNELRRGLHWTSSEPIQTNENPA
jgi:hypothetical protein